MKIPWFIEIAISYVLIVIACHMAYKDGYHEGYWKAIEDVVKVINGVCKIKEMDKEEFQFIHNDRNE